MKAIIFVFYDSAMNLMLLSTIYMMLTTKSDEIKSIVSTLDRATSCIMTDIYSEIA